jgi:hypothetical protein
MLPKDGSLKDVPCTDTESIVCWAAYINDITYSNVVRYLQMDTDWTQQPERNVSAQNHVARLLELGPDPKVVMENVKTVQSVDTNGVVRSDAPLEK